MKVKRVANWSDPATTEENEVLLGYLKWAWTSRAVSLAINVIMIMQLTYYCTDMLGLRATLVGTLLLASKLFDGVTDLFVGVIIDRTHTKLGKARPYEIFIVFVWLLTILLFSAPEMGVVGKSIFVFVLYTLINSICATFLNGGDPVYLARSIRSEKNRISIMSFNGAVIMVGMILVSISLPQLIATVGTTKVGWTLIAASFGIPCAIIGMLRFVFVKEVAAKESEKREKNQQISLKTGISCVAKNKYIWIFAAMTFVANFSSNIGTSVNTYYFKYIMGDIGLASIVSIGSMITPIYLMLFPLLSRKIGTVNILRIGTVIGIVGYALRIIGGTNMITLVIGVIMSSLAILPITMMANIYMIDCMDYGEWKTGVRIEGMLNAVSTFCNKLGGGVASGAVGLLMGLSGYDGSLEVQSAVANTSIIALFNYVPMVLTIILFILSIAYKIDKELPTIKLELAAKHVRK